MFLKYKKMISIILFIFIPIFIFISCGRIGQVNDTSQTNSASYKEFEIKSTEIKEQYNIPKDVTSISVEDYKNKWPSEKFTIASIDGTPEEIYPELDTLAKIGEQIEQEYPKFDEEAYVKHLQEENPSKDMSEAEVTAAIQTKIEEIQAEKRYIGFVKITSEEMQNEIKTQAIAKIKALKIQEKLKTQDKYYNNKLYPEEFWILFWRPWLWSPINRAKTDVFKEINNRFGLGKTQDCGTMVDSFRHTLLNILIAKYSENDYDKAGCIWVANVLMTAHEDGASRCNENTAYDRAMDLHNNAVGRSIYNANAWNRQVCIGISWGWFNIRYCYDRGASRDVSYFANLVEQKARQSTYLNLTVYPDQANISTYKDLLIRYL